jgi:putative endonuclease
MYVYILTTKTPPARYYVGSTSDLKRRLQEHNTGKSAHTAKYRPWIIKNAFWFSEDEKGFAFEKYLKTGSGRAFAKKHF